MSYYGGVNFHLPGPSILRRVKRANGRRRKRRKRVSLEDCRFRRRRLFPSASSSASFRSFSRDLTRAPAAAAAALAAAAIQTAAAAGKREEDEEGFLSVARVCVLARERPPKIRQRGRGGRSLSFQLSSAAVID